MKITNVKMIGSSDWDDLVQKTYQRIYDFQQQDGCKDRGTHTILVPDDDYDDYENDSVPEVVNHPEMGVSFKAWLERDPKQPLPSPDEPYLGLWWSRNFYPHVQMIANDLHKRGLLEAGEYVINIDW